MTAADITRVMIGAIGVLVALGAIGVLQKRKDRIYRGFMVPVTPYLRCFCIGNLLIFMGEAAWGFRHTLLQSVSPTILGLLSDLGLAVVIITLVWICIQVVRLNQDPDES